MNRSALLKTISLVAACAVPPSVGSHGSPVPASSPANSPKQAASDLHPQIVLDYGFFSGTLEDAILGGTSKKPVKLTYGGDLTIESQLLSGDLLTQVYTAKGGVRVHDLDTDLWADSLDVDARKGQDTAHAMWLHQQPYLLTARTLTVSPRTIVAEHGSITTAPPGSSPDLELRAKTITLYPDRNLVIARQGYVYLFHVPVFRTSYVSYHLHTNKAGVGGTGINPIAGQSSRYGAFVGIDVQQQTPMDLHYGGLLPTRKSPQLYFYATESLLASKKKVAPPAAAPAVRQSPLEAIHQFASTARGPLHYGDPLLFHEFLRDINPIQLLNQSPPHALYVNEAATYSMPASGNRRNDLYVSRLPEAGVHVSIPLTSPGPPPADGDYAAFRTHLRRFVPVGHADMTYGSIQEQPTGVDRDRFSADLKLDTEPYLIARNTVIVPSVTFTGNRYSKTNQPYHYEQLGIAVNHYFSDRTALGVQLLASDVHGTSPFNFDVLDTSREIDTRIQIGNHAFAISGLMRYDLVRDSLFDYKIAIAPSLPGLIPVIGYDFQSRSISLDVQVEGVTF